MHQKLRWWVSVSETKQAKQLREKRFEIFGSESEQRERERERETSESYHNSVVKVVRSSSIKWRQGGLCFLKKHTENNFKLFL